MAPFANFVGRTDLSRNRWDRLSRPRPQTLYLWYRTSPLPLIPYGLENRVEGTNPPLSIAGMTLIGVDALGRVTEFVAVPEPTALALLGLAGVALAARRRPA